MANNGEDKWQMCFVGLAMVHVIIHAQNSPQDFLDTYNAARAQVGVGPLIWDDNVAAYAQNYANLMAGTCNTVHSNGPYGENLASSSGNLSAAEVVKMWVGESQFYNQDSNSCVGGDCLHYTQVVWSNSVRLGCASVRCNKGGTSIVCNYDPPGNFVG